MASSVGRPSVRSHGRPAAVLWSASCLAATAGAIVCLSTLPSLISGPSDLLVAAHFSDQPEENLGTRQPEPVRLVIVHGGEPWLVALAAPVLTTFKAPALPYLLCTASFPLQEPARSHAARLGPSRALVLSGSSEAGAVVLPEGVTSETVTTGNEPTSASVLLLDRFWKTAERILCADYQDANGIVLASTLAGHLGVPVVLFDSEKGKENWAQALRRSGTAEIWAVAGEKGVPEWTREMRAKVTVLSHAEAQERTTARIGTAGIRNIIVTRVSFWDEGLFGSPGWLSPYLSLVRGAPVVTSSSVEAREAEDAVEALVVALNLQPRNVTILADHDSIGTKEVEVPSVYGDEPSYTLDLEPCSGAPMGQACSLGVGRIPFNSLEKASCLLMAGFLRERQVPGRPFRALMVANPKTDFSSLPLCETVGRFTAAELRNLRAHVDEFYGESPDDEGVREAAKTADLIIYQGHIADFGIFDPPGWRTWDTSGVEWVGEEPSLDDLLYTRSLGDESAVLDGQPTYLGREPPSLAISEGLWFVPGDARLWVADPPGAALLYTVTSGDVLLEGEGRLAAEAPAIGLGGVPGPVRRPASAAESESDRWLVNGPPIDARGFCATGDDAHPAPVGRPALAVLEEPTALETGEDAHPTSDSTDSRQGEATSLQIDADEALIDPDGASIEEFAAAAEASPSPAIRAERLPIVILQSCHSLEESRADTILRAGGAAVIGSVTSIHSASGSSFVKALLDGALYRGETLGEALRDARNYFLCLQDLKQRRGHTQQAKGHRVALSFRLWGDPELRLAPAMGLKPRRPPVKAAWSGGDEIRVKVPRRRLPECRTETYVARVFPGSQAAGVVRRIKDKPYRRLTPFYFFRLPMPRSQVDGEASAAEETEGSARRGSRSEDGEHAGLGIGATQREDAGLETSATQDAGLAMDRYSRIERDGDESPRAVYRVDSVQRSLYVLYFPGKERYGEEIVLKLRD